MANSIQLITPAISLEAAAAVTAKRFVGYDGQHCGAGKKAVGVAYFDAALGEQITLYGRGNVVEVTAGSGGLAVGDRVASDANGKGVTAAALAAAAPVVDETKATIDSTKLTVDSGATPVTSTAANGAVITAAADAVQIAAGFLAAPVLSGGVPPVELNGIVITAAAENAAALVLLD